MNAGSPYDQFSTFRTVSWLSYVPLDSTWTCSFLYNGISQPGGTSFATQYGYILERALLVCITIKAC